jgi:tRNA pseudouridine55 synthase
MANTQITGEGMWLVHKPTGISSFGVVARVRRITGIRKVGHAGTLDPEAEGLMIILVGKDYTRKADSFLKLDKTYEVEATLGQTSTTGDREGELAQVSDKQPSEDEVREALRKFQGEIMQTPPVYSAIKVGGQRAYKLAREGKEVTIEPRKVTVASIELLNYSYPKLSFRADVSSGTYIRSLAEDIGATLGTGAYMSALTRTRVGDYNLDDAVHLD